jgi:putative transposase
MQLLQQAYPALSVRTLCRWLGISRSWYYAHPAAGARAGADAADGGEIELRDAIERLVLDFPGYGYRRVTQALRRRGWLVNHKRVLRVMREESLLCQLKRRFVVTTDSAHGYRTYPNLLAGATLDGLDRAWVADITYIRLPTTFVYLACILDACSRRCIGWKLSRQIDTSLTLAALEMAIARRQPRRGLIQHSDRGVQYASFEYVSRLEEIGARVSMSATGNPYDNAKAESFFKTLKREEVYLKDYQTFAEAEANLGQFIDDVYNTKRLHSSLGYQPPAEFEAAFVQSMDEVTLTPVR